MGLLGDSAHAMQPNLGQGGCMAIEDAYELAVDLSKAVADKGGDSAAVNVEEVRRLAITLGSRNARVLLSS